MRSACFRVLLLFLWLIKAKLSSGLALAEEPFFEIQVVDRETGRGVPMVQLATTHDVVFVTDNAGRIALNEPQWNDQTIFFSVTSPGYRFRPDGFGIAGVRLKIQPGASAVVEIDRVNPAERLYRITGQDLYLDSERLKHPVPLKNPLGSAMVSGQDSVQVVPYRQRLYWFWGDTNRLSYPLGLFRTAGATSPLPADSQLPAADGIDLQYFTANDGFARAMVDVPNPKGVVWIDGACVVKDGDGHDRMVAHFSRREGLTKQLEHGLLIYNDEREIFEVLKVLCEDEAWRFLHDHPVRVTERGVDYLMFGNPFPVTRVPATLNAIQDPEAYESWTCLADESVSGEGGVQKQADSPSSEAPDRNRLSLPELDQDGHPNWQWKKQPPVTQKEEHQWIRRGHLKSDQARFVPMGDEFASDPGAGDPAKEKTIPGKPVLLHSGTVFYNNWRNCWVMVAVASATDKESPSFLGELWYSEAPTAQGPFRRAIKIASHPKQTFYNPCHHPFLDEENGRIIYIEGTYCNTFTNSPPTPRYNYNQLMYRLDLNNVKLPDSSENGK